MILDERLLIAAIGALFVHAALWAGLSRLPERRDPPPPEHVAIRVEERPPVEPAKEPDPEPPKAKPPDPPPPEKIVHERPRQHVDAPPRPTPPHAAPQLDQPETTGPTTDTPVFGVTMESTSTAGTGPVVPIGNATRAQPGPTTTTAAPPPLAAPVAAYEATKMPLPQGQCYGKYTDEARAAGDEGVVVLDLVVGEAGRARDITVVSGLPHGLTDAALAALRACRFSPGEKDGAPVAVKIRGFKIRFVLSNAD